MQQYGRIERSGNPVSGRVKQGREVMPFELSRRALLKVGGLGAATLMAPSVLRRTWAQEPFTVRVPGGYGDAWDAAFFKPFAEATGITGTAVVSKDFPFNEFKLSVETGAYRWSMAAGITKELYFRLRDADLMDPIDLDTPDITVRTEGTVMPEWLPYGLFCFTMVYRTASYSGELNSYRDMWNVTDFPGRRSLRKRAVDAIEMTARGIGIPTEEIYQVLETEEGWNKVFAGLDQIRPDIAVWWESDAQMDQLIGSGDLDIFPIASHRAQRLINEGAPITINYTDGYFTTQGWAIPKGSPQGDIAREFIKFAAQPEREAEFMKSTLMGPMHPRALDFLAPDLAKILPTYPDNLAKMREQDSQFWLKNGEAASTRFDEWILRG
jgi:putative spermidine/putrescine transport system substrate-binding protein